MKNRRRTGFTLVELLVVITIIAMLMGLLLPAVQNARESGRRTECLNNIKQLMVAARSYEASKKELPGYANEIAKSGTTSRLASWTIMLFPYLDREDVWRKWSDPTVNVANSVYTPYMQILTCSSDPPDSNDQPWLAYVVNCGIPDNFRFGGVRRERTTANGVFFDRFTGELPSNGPKAKRLAMSLDHIPDGASNTLMFSENIQADRYANANWLATASAQNPWPQATVFEIERSTGFVWDPGITNNTLRNPAQKINGDKAAPPPSGTIGSLDDIQPYFYARPSSSHSSGVNIAMCGGETLFLREDINYVVYQQLMTSNGRLSDMYSDSSNPNDPKVSPKAYILSDADWK
ncbi:MAG: DUF1559 domain-containing protein [Pirellulales bacterium]|nr:DUF1559 domain-containing protein [Pirellulales bacterium]